MAHHFGDNVHTKSFTPREYQVELLDAAKERNIIVCLGTESGKSFIAMKLIQEMANDTRRSYGRRRDGGRCGKRTLYLVEQKGKAKKVSIGLRNLTDLTVSNCWRSDSTLTDWSDERWVQEICSNQVLVMGSKICYGLLKRDVLSLKFVNLLIFDQCHQATKGHPYTMIMLEFYKRLPRSHRPRILGLTAPLLLLLGCPLSDGEESQKAPHPGCLEARLERLEKNLDCTAETASDIVSLLRYCPRPRELVVEWSLAKEVDPVGLVLSSSIESELTAAWNFLQDHRYDPMEIYQDAEFAEELSCIPDPKIDPLSVLKDFLHILRTLGPWCADRAALLLLIHLDKLKVKTPYERHFLLLCMMTTVMVKIRGICELTFLEFKECERIYKFSTPKVLRFLEILLEFLPPVAEATTNIPIFQSQDSGDNISKTESPQKILYKEDENDCNTQASIDGKLDVSEKSCSQCNSISTNAEGSKCVCIVDNKEVCCENSCNNIENLNELQVSKSDDVQTELSNFDCDRSDVAIKDALSNDNEGATVSINLVNENEDKKDISYNHHSTALLLQVENSENGELGLGNGLPNSKKESNNKTVLPISNKDDSEVSGVNNREPLSWERGGRGRRRGGSRGRGRGGKNFGRGGGSSTWNKSGHELPVSDSLCGIVFVDGRFTAKILYHLLNDLRRSDPRFAMLAAQYTVGCSMPVAGDSNSMLDPREAEAEYRKQEEVLKRFRTHECNLLIGPTGWALEDGGLELPRCNLVLRFDHDSITTDLCSPPVSSQSSTNLTENGVSVEETCNSVSKDFTENEKMLKQKHNSDLVKRTNEETISYSDLSLNEDGSLKDSQKDSVTSIENDLIVTGIKSTVNNSANEMIINEGTNNLLVCKSPVDGVPLMDNNSLGEILMITAGDGSNHPSSKLSPTENTKENSSEESSFSTPITSHESISHVDKSEKCINLDSVADVSESQDDREVNNMLDTKTYNDTISEEEQSRDLVKGSSLDSAVSDATLEMCGNRETNQLDECIVGRTPVSYHSYARSRARARAPDAHHIIMAAEGEEARRVVDTLAHFMQIEEMLLRRCKNREPPEEEEVEADGMALHGEIYCPADALVNPNCNNKTLKLLSYPRGLQQWSNSTCKEISKEEKACVTLATAIALVNRYCAKLPSDTFTRLTPLWSLKEVKGTGGTLMYVCALRLPINSPVKQDIMGHPMPSRALARRSAALEACKILHQAKELDDDLMPVGKESFRAEVESEEEEEEDEEDEEDSEEDLEESIKSDKDNSQKISEKTNLEDNNMEGKESPKSVEVPVEDSNEAEVSVESMSRDESIDGDREKGKLCNDITLDEKGEFDSLGVETIGKNGKENDSSKSEEGIKEEKAVISHVEDCKEGKECPDNINKHFGVKINGEMENEVISDQHISKCIKSLSNFDIADETKHELFGKDVSELHHCLEKIGGANDKCLTNLSHCKKGENGLIQCGHCKIETGGKEYTKTQIIESKEQVIVEERKEPGDISKDKTSVDVSSCGSKEAKETKEHKRKARKKHEEEELEEEGEEEGGVGEEMLGNSVLDRPRPGTTKRRQYYYKRTADALTDCRPLPLFPAYLYNLGMKLVCPLPDEQNTRGRRIHPPEDSPRGFGILTLKEIPKICPFPIFTRSGEVRVCLDPCETSGRGVTKYFSIGSPRQKWPENAVEVLPNNINGFSLPEPQQILLTEEQLSKALAFLNYTFAGVLRLQRYLMAFDPVASENSYLIVPTMTTKGTDEGGNNDDIKDYKKEMIEVDWEFVDLIYGCKGESKPVPVDEEERKSFLFEASLYHDAVVMPWYRNQDQPQYFYVAEICTQLSPKSSFPGSEYKTFEEYYFKKYSIQICNREQPLLDVDHTSARLNFLTPRYVNRKGVALPTSSEETKRAKRESLEQKQILVPELCSRHPFPASLWRKAVCLPCILYRLNALLLADQLRARVAREINLGLEKVPKDFEWPPLDFGWSLADVLKKSKENDNSAEGSKNVKSGKSGSGAVDKSSDEEDEVSGEGDEKIGVKQKSWPEKKRKRKKRADERGFSGDDRSDDDEAGDDDDSEKNDGEDWMEIGTWSNEMAMQASSEGIPPLPHNVTMVGEGGREGWGASGEGERIRYGSPSIWKGNSGPVEVFRGLEHDLEGLETTDSSDDDDDDEVPEDEDGVEEAVLIPEEEVEDRGHHPRGKLRIQFKSDYLAEAVEVLDDDLVEGQVLKAITEAGEDDAEEDDNVGEEEEEEEEETDWLWDDSDNMEEREMVERYVEHFEKAVMNNKKMIEGSGMLLHSNKVFSLCTKVEKPIQMVEKLEMAPLNPICMPLESLLENETESVNEDRSESFNTNTEDGDFVTMESLSDDDADDIFLDVLEEDKNWEPEEPRNDCASECESHRSSSQNSFSSSTCSCCSSCSSCSISVSSSSEEDLLEDWPSAIPVKGSAQGELPDSVEETKSFSFDAQPPLEGHPGPSPPLLLQALTMSNANDGINLERLETIGDSFLKYAITAYLYCTHHSIHEGKLSHLRSKQVSNVNLYRLGKRKRLGESMIAAKFEPHDNWLPPCYHVPLHLERALIRAGLPPSHWNGAEVPSLAALSPAQIGRVVREKGRRLMMKSLAEQEFMAKTPIGARMGGDSGFRTVSFEGNSDNTLSAKKDGLKNGNLAGTDSSFPLGGKSMGCDSGTKRKGFEGCPGGNFGNVVANSTDPLLSSQAQTPFNNRVEELPCFVPYNLVTQQSIPDKSIADCVEALIGAYLIACGPRGALLFMAWLGIRVLPSQKIFLSNLKDKVLKEGEERPVGCMLPKEAAEPKGELYQVCYGALSAPPPPLALSSFSQRNEQEVDSRSGLPDVRCKHCLKLKKNVNGDIRKGVKRNNLVASDEKLTEESTNKMGIMDPGEVQSKPSVQKELKALLGGLSAFEKHIGYYFRDRSLLLQALTHASYSPNRLTDCYQRLEFLGDAVLDYLITRHLYEDPRQHSPGALTDLRSALVNNTIFASLAVRHGFHRFFLHLSPGLHSVVERFVRMQASNGHAICEEYYLIEEEECEEAEDVEVPKALGDVFESVAGAIFLDSGMSLDAVWHVYYRMMKAEIEQFSTNVPKSPIRELLEMEPETAKFGKPEKLADGRRVRVTVEVFGKGTFKGIGRNYRIAKCTAAKCALRQLKKRGLLFPRKN